MGNISEKIFAEKIEAHIFMFRNYFPKVVQFIR